MSESSQQQPAHNAAFELEAGSIEEFATLLELRESLVAHAHQERTRAAVRRAVCISALADTKYAQPVSRPSVRRYVVASFAYGGDLVSYRIEVSNGPEFTDPPEEYDPRVRQRQVHKELRSQIEERVSGLEVPVLNGELHHSSAPGERRN